MNRAEPNGFTLVEMLVSLALIGAMSLMLLGGVGSARRVWERDDRVSGGGEAVAAAQSVLRALIERAYPWTAFTGSRPVVDFDGGPDGVTLVGVAPEAERPSLLRRYGIGVDEGSALVLDIAAAGRTAGVSVTRRPLLAGIRGIALAYYGAAAPDGTPRWRSRWQDQPTLPELVRLRVVFAAGDPRFWPDLIVRPAATLDSACVVTAAGACKGR